MEKFGSWLYRKLFLPDRSLGNYVLRVWAIQLFGSIPFIAIGYFVAEAAGDSRSIDISIRSRADMVILLLALGIAAPLIETLILWASTSLLRLFLRNRVIIAAISGVGWGIAHAVSNDLPNGFGASWAFFCMTAAFLGGARTSEWRGIFVAFTIHAVNNTLAALMITLGILMEKGSPLF